MLERAAVCPLELPMPVRKLQSLTLASLAAWRKSTGPRAERGVARVALNPPKHGQRAVALQQRLVRAGYREGEASGCLNWRRIRLRISKAFARPDDRTCDHSGRHVDRMANCIWVCRRKVQLRPKCNSRQTKLWPSGLYGVLGGSAFMLGGLAVPKDSEMKEQPTILLIRAAATRQSKPKTPLESTRLANEAVIYLTMQDLPFESRQLTDKYSRYSIFDRNAPKVSRFPANQALCAHFDAAEGPTTRGEKKITSKMKEQPTMLLIIKDRIFYPTMSMINKVVSSPNPRC
jgi:hypothetical protein